MSSLSRGNVPSVPSYVRSVPRTFCPLNWNFHTNGAKRPGCPWDVPNSSLGRFQGIPTTKFVYVIFLYRFFSLPIMLFREIAFFARSSLRKLREDLAGLESWAWLAKTFGVLQNLSSTGFLLCETFCRTFQQNPKGCAEFRGTFESSDPSFEDWLFKSFLPPREK